MNQSMLPSRRRLKDGKEILRIRIDFKLFFFPNGTSYRGLGGFSFRLIERFVSFCKDDAHVSPMYYPKQPSQEGSSIILYCT
jgi:hypothetical protein